MKYNNRKRNAIPVGSSITAADFTLIPCFLQRSVKAFNNSSRSDCMRSALTWSCQEYTHIA